MAQNKDIVLVIDVSASMQPALQGTRFAEAQRHALAILDALPSDRQMALIAAGRQPRVLTFFTNEEVLLRQAINELQADDAPGNMREAILLVYMPGMSTQEIVVIGDRAYRGMTRPMCRASSCGISKLLAENGMSIQPAGVSAAAWH